jgi:hypothetical protein
MKNGLFWFLAVVITLGAAVYHRMTGPTYPVRGRAVIDGTTLSYKLPRSAENSRDAEVRVKAPGNFQGYLTYRRFKTRDPWAVVPLARRGEDLVARLPKQPAAGKLAYRLLLRGAGGPVSLTGERQVVLRFKNPVSTSLLVPHVIVLFAGMLFAVASGLAAVDKKRNPRRYVVWTLALLFLGGFIFGPLIQKQAFGMYWSGFPVGKDLTDTKALVSFLFWVAAWAAGRKGKPARGVVLAASVLTLITYFIPHSVLGSELDYTGFKG